MLTIFCVYFFAEILHFENFPAIFNYIQINDLVQMFNSENETGVFDMIFDRVAKNLSDDNNKMLNDFVDICADGDKRTKNDILLNIAVIAVVQLSKNKKAKDHFDKYRIALLAIIRKHFAGKMLSTEDKVSEFVARTLSAYVIIIKTLVSKAPEEIDDQLVEITKQYLRNSVSCIEKVSLLLGYQCNILFCSFFLVQIDCRNSCAVKLLNVVLNNKIVLRYEDAELTAIIDSYWTNFQDCCLGDDADDKNVGRDDASNSMDTVLKLIFDFKSTEDWIQLLNAFDDVC